MKNRILSIILCLGIICFNAYAAEQPEFAQQIASEEESFVAEPMEEVIVEEAPDLIEQKEEIEDNSISLHSEETETNVAIGSQVTVTNTSGAVINTNVGDGPGNCVDGSYATGTSGNGVYEYDLYLELNGIYPINKVNMVFLICKFNGNFRIETSVDGITYTPAGNITNTLTPFTVDTNGSYKFSAEFDTVFAKYIKIADTAAHTGLGFRVAEVEVIADNTSDMEVFNPNVTYYAVTDDGEMQAENLFAGTMRAKASIFYYGTGKEVTLVSGLYNTKTNEMISYYTNPVTLVSGANTIAVDTEVPEELTGLIKYEELAGANIALGAECVMMSSDNGSECEANNGAFAFHATDGDKNTKAQATGVYNWTLGVNLGQVYEISSIRILFADNGFPVEYDIFTSEDGQEWEEVASFKNNDRGGEHIINIDTIGAQYIKVADNVPQPGVRQMQVYEIEVFEKKIKSDFAIRSFIIDNATDKNPLINSPYILN